MHPIQPQEHQQTIALDGITMRTTSQFMETTERVQLFVPEGQQVSAKARDGSFMLISEMKQQANKHGLQLVYSKNGTAGNATTRSLNIQPFEELVGMDVVSQPYGFDTLFCLVKRKRATYLEWLSVDLEQPEGSEVWKSQEIKLPFTTWDVTRDAQGKYCLLFASSTAAPFMYQPETGSFTLLKFKELDKVTVRKVTLGQTTINGNNYLTSYLLTEEEELDDDFNPTTVSRCFVHIYKDTTPILSTVIQPERYDLGLVTDIHSEEADGNSYTFLVAENDKNGSDVYQIQVRNFLNLRSGMTLEKTSAKPKIDLLPAVSISGKVSDLHIGYIDYHNDLKNTVGTGITLFLEATYAHNAKTENVLLKCDPVATAGSDFGWEVATGIRGIQDAIIHYNPNERNVDIFCQRSTASSTLAEGGGKTPLLEYIRIDKSTSGYTKQPLQLQASPETTETVIYSNCTFCHFEADEQQSWVTNASGQPLIELSATTEQQVLISGSYYQLSPGVYTTIPLNHDGTLEVLTKADSIESPVFLFTFPGKQQAIRLKSSYFAEQKIAAGPSETAAPSVKSDWEVLRQIQEQTKAIDSSAPLTLVSREQASAREFAQPLLRSTRKKTHPSYLAIEFKKGKPAFFHSEQTHHAYLETQPPVVQFGFGFINDLGKKAIKLAGDAVQVISNAAESIKNIVISTASRVYKVVVSIANTLIETVLETFEAVCSFIAGIAKKIWSAVKDVVNYLGYLFNFKDILVTKDALKTTVNNGLEALEALMAPHSPIRTTARQFADQVIERLRSFKSTHATAPAENPAKGTGSLLATTEVAYMRDQMRRNNDEGNQQSAMVQLANGMGELALEAEKSGLDFGFIMDLIKSVRLELGALTTIINKITDAVIELLIAAIEGFMEKLDDLFNLVGKLFKLIRTTINASYASIPFLGPLLKKVIGTDISLNDLWCFVLAVPVTVMRKLVGSAVARPVVRTGSVNTAHANAAAMRSIAGKLKQVVHDYPKETAASVKTMIELFSEISYWKKVGKPLDTSFGTKDLIFGLIQFSYGFHRYLEASDKNDTYAKRKAYMDFAASAARIAKAFGIREVSATGTETLVNGVFSLAFLARMGISAYCMVESFVKETPGYQRVSWTLATVHNCLAEPVRLGSTIVLLPAPEVPMAIGTSAFFRSINIGAIWYEYAMERKYNH